MRVRHWLTLLVLAALTPAAPAQSIFLAETNLRDACFNNELTMQLKGTVQVQQAGQPSSFPRTAVATHSYFERVLEIKDGQAERTARFYNRAEATITDNNEKFSIALKANHTLLVAHRVKEDLVVYHPAEPLTREEADITAHFDTLAVTGLLPRKETKVGDTWQVPRDVVLALVDLSAIEKSDVTGKLEKIDGDFAYMSFRGTVQGIDMAAPVSVVVKDSSAAFNTKLKRLTYVEWKVADQRQQGPVSPGLSAEVVFQLKRVPIDTPTQLGEVALVKVPLGPPPAHLTNITYRNLNKGFEFQFSRDWYVVSQTNDGRLTLRLIDSRGEFITQCTVTPWTKVDPKNLMKLDDFAKIMRESKGWQQKEGPPLDETEKIKSAAGYTIFKITAEGKLAGADAVRSFYLVANPGGDQVLFDFTMLPTQASKLDGRDLAMVQALQFVSTTPSVEGRPVSNEK